MEVGFYEKSGHLNNNSGQPFILLKMMGNTFVLTKVQLHATFEKSIHFSFLGHSFYGTFSRNVNLLYPKKLSEVVQHLGIETNSDLQYQWLTLYEVHNFNIPPSFTLKIDTPIYGESVNIHLKHGNHKKSIISNLFKYAGQAFYFLNSSSQIVQQLALISDESPERIYGLTYLIKKQIFCIPFQEIISERPCPVKINAQIKPLLEGTCYINYHGHYCSGFILDSKTIISARHVIPFEDRKIGLEIGVMMYPFHEEKVGIVKRIGQGSVDVIEIVLANKILSKKETSCIKISQSLDSKEYNLQDLVGHEVKTLGFGKFPYNAQLFKKIQLVMPTIEIGVVSKIINMGHSSIFIKTDNPLSEGFSGCALWMKNQIIGMAIFILVIFKNKSYHSNLNKHNFSYTIDFIEQLLSEDTEEYLISSINPELECFDRIQTRYKIPLMPKL